MTNLKNVGAFIKECCNVFLVRGLTETTEPTCLQGESKGSRGKRRGGKS